MNVRFCGKCGAAMEPDGRFCEKCGWQLPGIPAADGNTASSPAPARPPAAPPVAQVQAPPKPAAAPMPSSPAASAAPQPLRPPQGTPAPTAGGPNAFNEFSREMNRGAYNRANPVLIWIIVIVGLLLSGAGIFLLLK